MTEVVAVILYDSTAARFYYRLAPRGRLTPAMRAALREATEDLDEVWRAHDFPPIWTEVGSDAPRLEGAVIGEMYCLAYSDPVKGWWSKLDFE